MMAAAILLALPAPALAVTHAHNVSYVGGDGTTQTAADAIVLTADDTDWSGEAGAEASEGFYYAQGDVTISGAITVSGDVRLILGDGATLTIGNGINVDAANDATLQIFPQANGTGCLSGPANGTAGQAGIGSGQGQTAGAVTIVGGVIDVVGGSGAAGIGGGAGSIGAVTITGGTITAKGGAPTEGVSGGAGIGNGGTPSGATVADTGRLALQQREVAKLTVTATGAAGAAGIGGGSGNTTQVTIDGATVTATAGAGAAAIGGGEGGAGSVAIEDATVTATSESGVAIGSGNNLRIPAGSTLTQSVSITGASQVTARGGYAGIGSSPGVSSTGTLAGFAPNGTVTIGVGATTTAVVDSVALSDQAYARAITGTVTADYHFLAFGGTTTAEPTDVIAIAGGPAPVWNAYRHLKVQPLALQRLSVSPAEAELKPQTTVAFSVVGEAIVPSDFPKDANLASALGVTWSVSGNADPTTTIGANGVLFIGSSETSKDITVTATLPEGVSAEWPNLATTLTAQVEEPGEAGGTGGNADNGTGNAGGNANGSGNASGSGATGSSNRPGTSSSGSSSSTSRPSSSSSSNRPSSSSTGKTSTSSSSSRNLPKTGDRQAIWTTAAVLASLLLAASGIAVLRPRLGGRK